MTTITPAEVILAAANSVTGESDNAAWTRQVAARATDLAMMLRPKSDVHDKVEQLLGDGLKVFVGTLVGLEKEDSSNRVLGIIKTGTTQQGFGIGKKPLPEGCESFRTDRLDSGGREIASALKDALHPNGRDAAPVPVQIRVFIFMEKVGSTGREVRVIKKFEVVS